MVSSNKLILEIRNNFPTIRKPEDYVNIILEGIRLKALDRNSSKRKSKFRKIKTNAFSKSHKVLKSLIKIDNMDHSVSPMSERDAVVFNFTKAQLTLNHEKNLLLKHIDTNKKVKDLSIKILKLLKTSTTNTIRIKLDEGDIFKQGSTYEKVFNTLKDNNIKPSGYLWFGIRPINIPKYYLSDKAQKWCQK